jgi:anti-anti-sigma factor
MTPQSGPSTITPHGEYDEGTAGWLVNEVDLALFGGATAVVVDLDELDFGGSTLISDLIHARRRCADQGATFAVSARSEHWHRLFRIAGVGYLLDPEA